VRQCEKNYLCARVCARRLRSGETSGLGFLLDHNLNCAVTPWTSLTVTTDSLTIFMGSSSAMRRLSNLEALRGERIGEIGGSDRSKQLVIFAGFPGELDGHLIQQGGLLFGGAFFRCRALESVMRIFSRRLMLAGEASSASLCGSR